MDDMGIYYDIIKNLFYDIHFDLGVGYVPILDFVNNLSPVFCAVVGVHLGCRMLRQMILG